MFTTLIRAAGGVTLSQTPDGYVVESPSRYSTHTERMPALEAYASALELECTGRGPHVQI